jgi:hypothetical protein
MKRLPMTPEPRRCVVLGCQRRREQSPSGRVVYARCAMHTAEALHGAFGPNDDPGHHGLAA